MQHAIPGIHMHTQGQTEHSSCNITDSIYFASHKLWKFLSQDSLQKKNISYTLKVSWSITTKICWQCQKIKEFIHLRIHFLIYIYLTILSGIIKEVIDIFNTNLFLLHFNFLLQFFEEVMRRKSYAVPNSKNIHIPTPHEPITVLPTHFKTKEKSINFYY